MNNQPTPDETPKDWRDEFLKRVLAKNGSKEYLFRLLKLIQEFSDNRKPTGFISDMYSVWANSPFVDHSDIATDSALIVNHLAFLAHLQSAFYCFTIESDYVDALIEGEEGKRDE